MTHIHRVRVAPTIASAAAAVIEPATIRWLSALTLCVDLVVVVGSAVACLASLLLPSVVPLHPPLSLVTLGRLCVCAAAMSSLANRFFPFVVLSSSAHAITLQRHWDSSSSSNHRGTRRREATDRTPRAESECDGDGGGDDSTTTLWTVRFGGSLLRECSAVTEWTPVRPAAGAALRTTTAEQHARQRVHSGQKESSAGIPFATTPG